MRLTSRPAIRPASLVACRWASLQDAGADLGRAVALAPDLDLHVTVRGADDFVGDALDLFLDLVELAPHEPLDGIDGVLGIGDRLAPSDLADEDFTLVVERNHRRGQPAPFLVGDDLGLLALHD